MRQKISSYIKILQNILPKAYAIFLLKVLLFFCNMYFCFIQITALNIKITCEPYVKRVVVLKVLYSLLFHTKFCKNINCISFSRFLFRAWILVTVTMFAL